MGADELGQQVLGGITVDPARWRQMVRRAAVHVADRVAAEHPHPLDQEMPQLAGQLIAKNPAVRQQLHDLIDALGLQVGLAELQQLQDREVGLEAELIAATDTNQRLKEQQQ